MDIRDILFTIILTIVPAGMAARAYRLGLRHGEEDERRRQNRRARYSSVRNSRSGS